MADITRIRSEYARFLVWARSTERKSEATVDALIRQHDRTYSTLGKELQAQYGSRQSYNDWRDWQIVIGFHKHKSIVESIDGGDAAAILLLLRRNSSGIVVPEVLDRRRHRKELKRRTHNSVPVLK